MLVVRRNVVVSRLRDDCDNCPAVKRSHNLRPTPGPAYSAMTALAPSLHWRDLESDGYDVVRALAVRRVVINDRL